MIDQVEVTGGTDLGTTDVIPPGVRDAVPETVLVQLAMLPQEQQEAFTEIYHKKARDIPTGRLMWFLGLHYIYFGKRNRQILFWLTLGGFAIWGLIDLFRIPGMVRRYNHDLAFATLAELQAPTP